MSMRRTDEKERLIESQIDESEDAVLLLLFSLYIMAILGIPWCACGICSLKPSSVSFLESVLHFIDVSHGRSR